MDIGPAITALQPSQSGLEATGVSACARPLLGTLVFRDLRQTVKQSSERASRTLADADREHILETLEQANWLIGGQDGAATRLGLPRTTLIYKMRKLGIEIRRSTRARPLRRLADEQCAAAPNC